jgi:hypothetical protein
MNPVVACRNILSDKRLCGASVVLLKAEYSYRSTPIAGAPFPQQRTLVEAKYEIDCPNCGKRTQIEKF